MEQYIKLFSNPVSGIACEVDAYNRDHRVKYHCQNIRYSKSMILKALYFWNKQMVNYFNKIRTVYNPLRTGIITQLQDQIIKIMDIREKVSKFPDTFLFSHRYIQDMSVGMDKPGYKYTKSMNIQSNILNKKYPMLFEQCNSYGFQEQTMDIYYRIKTNVGIEFTVFPNEHPYIPRQKISRVGMTEKGNVYVLHKNGAQKK